MEHRQYRITEQVDLDLDQYAKPEFATHALSRA